MPLVGGIDRITETAGSVVIAASAAYGGTGTLTYQWARAATNTGYGGATVLSNGSGISGATTVTLTDASATWTGLAAGSMLWYYLRVTDAASLQQDYSFAACAQPQVDAQGRTTSELERPWNVPPALRPNSTLYMLPFAEEVVLSGYNAEFGAATTGMIGPYGQWNAVGSMTAYPPHFNNFANQFPGQTAAPWYGNTIRFNSGAGDGFASTTNEVRAALFIPVSGLIPNDAWTWTSEIRFLAAQSSISTPIHPAGLYIKSGIQLALQITSTALQVVWQHDQAATNTNQLLSVNTSALAIQSGDDVVVKLVQNGTTLSDLRRLRQRDEQESQSAAERLSHDHAICHRRRPSCFWILPVGARGGHRLDRDTSGDSLLLDSYGLGYLGRHQQQSHTSVHDASHDTGFSRPYEAGDRRFRSIACMDIRSNPGDDVQRVRGTRGAERHTRASGLLGSNKLVALTDETPPHLPLLRT